MTKIFVVAISFSAALAVLPATAQTGYGVKKMLRLHQPSTAVGTTRTKVRIGQEPARLGYAATMPAPSASDSYFYSPAPDSPPGKRDRRARSRSAARRVLQRRDHPRCEGVPWWLSGAHRTPHTEPRFSLELRERWSAHPDIADVRPAPPHRWHLVEERPRWSSLCHAEYKRSTTSRSSALTRIEACC